MPIFIMQQVSTTYLFQRRGLVRAVLSASSLKYSICTGLPPQQRQVSPLLRLTIVTERGFGASCMLDGCIEKHRKRPVQN